LGNSQKRGAGITVSRRGGDHRYVVPELTTCQKDNRYAAKGGKVIGVRERRAIRFVTVISNFALILPSRLVRIESEPQAGSE
jgi:hypothetical protein